jgi:hypothetical protein
MEIEVVFPLVSMRWYFHSLCDLFKTTVGSPIRRFEGEFPLISIRWYFNLLSDSFKTTVGGPMRI